jgi:AmmeMemoRadiSam system protein B
MPVPERPQLRPYLTIASDHNRLLVLADGLRLSDRQLRVTPQELGWIQLFDGTRTLRDVQAAAMRRAGGQLLPLELFARLAARLEEAFFLDGPRFRQIVEGSIRPPSCIGAYAAEPNLLRRQLTQLFTASDGPGLPGEPRPDSGLRAALVPHIDYARGGSTYGWGFKEVVEKTDAALFVIVGTSHYSGQRFSLTRKHFRTPLGIARTNQAFVDRLVGHYGDGLFDDELMAHLPEHSIELEVVLLQYLLDGKRDFRIVPLVVGSFQDCVLGGRNPMACADVARMVDALRATLRETDEPVFFLISGDLAHLGPKFGDPLPVEEPVLMRSRNMDQAILQQAAAADPAGYFQVIAAEGDARRICGLPPTYLVLETLRPKKGQVLHYGQYVHPAGEESVSFASMAFYE